VARKQQEEALREITQTLQALAHAAPVAIHTADLEGKVRLWNPAAERLFGRAAVLCGPLPPLVDGPAGAADATPPPAGRSLQGLPTKCRKKDSGLIDVSLGGRARAEAVTSRYPNVGVLYISDYTDNAVLRNGVMRSENTLLPKSFRPDDLLYKIREVLDRTALARAAACG
jgi:hypothetical protein